MTRKLRGSVKPMNPSAVKLFASHFSTDSRVLVLGATGWFGRTALAMLEGVNCPKLCLASKSRSFLVNSTWYRAEEWTDEVLAEFSPTHVLDFAFRIPGSVKDTDETDGQPSDSELINRSVLVALHPSVLFAMGVSSGAAVVSPNSFRGQLAGGAYAANKRRLEDRFSELKISKNRAITVIRPWSVTGGHVQNIPLYALSSMVWQATTERRILIEAPSIVSRRYCSVEDLLASAIATSQQGYVRFLDSGGPLVEIGELARLVASFFPGISVEELHTDRRNRDGDNYFPKEDSWTPEAINSGLTPLSLEAQIENVVRSLERPIG